MNYIILKRTILNSNKENKSKNIHTVGGEKIQLPYELQIVAYTDVEGFYLLYLDKSGEVITDTYHETMNKALEQAEWEFSVLQSDWTEVN